MSDVRPDQTWQRERRREKSKHYINDRQVGKRPSMKECLEGWVRAVECDPSRLKPDTLASNAPRKPQGKDLIPWDEYCWGLVIQAAAKIPSPTQADLVLEIAYHRATTGSIAKWKMGLTMAINPAHSRPTVERGRTCVIAWAEDEYRAGVKLFHLASVMWVSFRDVLQQVINEAEPFVKPKPEEDHLDVDNSPIQSPTWGGGTRREA